MDLFAHIIWTSILFYNVDSVALAVLFSVLPDILSFGPNFLYIVFTKGFSGLRVKSVREFAENLPPYVFTVYNITHSLVVFGAAFSLMWMFFGPPVYMLGWLFHILLDIPTHCRKVFPVKFLYPLSEYAFPGVNWSTKWFMAANWGSIIAFLLMRAR